VWQEKRPKINNPNILTDAIYSSWTRDRKGSEYFSLSGGPKGFLSKAFEYSEEYVSDRMRSLASFNGERYDW